MFKIDGANTVNALPARTAPGVAPGWFEQTPGAGPGTVLTGEWLNMWQAEFLAVLAAAGIVPDKAIDTQILAAIRAVNIGNSQAFAVAGTFAFVVPDDVTRVRVATTGGGGSGGTYQSQSTGGAAGGTAFKKCTVTPGESIAVVVGAGGSSAGQFNAGGTSSFGAFCSATGGGNFPGNGAGGDWNVKGGDGIPYAGNGGPSFWGGGGLGTWPGGSPAIGEGKAPGSGGGFGISGISGGAPGLVLVEW